MILAVAYLGGDLVYRQNIGVNHSPGKWISKGFTPVMNEGGLPQNKLTRGYIDGTPTVLLRRGDTIHAIAETCAHMGGPLAEGKLLENNSVVCPWHGSRFDLATGEVLDGPSAYPQPCFEARIRDGQIEVRQVDRNGSPLPALEQTIQ